MRTKVTEEYLLSKGFIEDIEYMHLYSACKFENDPYADKKQYVDSTGQVIVSFGFTNRYGENSYSVHVDNKDYESIGFFDFLYVDEFETVLDLFKDDVCKKD